MGRLTGKYTKGNKPSGSRFFGKVGAGTALRARSGARAEPKRSNWAGQTGHARASPREDARGGRQERRQDPGTGAALPRRRVPGGESRAKSAPSRACLRGGGWHKGGAELDHRTRRGSHSWCQERPAGTAERRRAWVAHVGRRRCCSLRAGAARQDQGVAARRRRVTRVRKNEILAFTGTGVPLLFPIESLVILIGR